MMGKAQVAGNPPPYSQLEPPGDPYDLERATSPLPDPPTPRRGSDESSTARSEYLDDKETFVTTRNATTKVYDVMHTGYHRDYRIFNPDGTAAYYVDNSTFTPETPDVTLHAGDEKSNPIIGVGKFSTMFSKHISIGLGDPKANGGRDTVWYMMERSSNFLKQSEFKFNMKLTPSDAHAHTFIWKRTSKSVVGDDATFSMSNFKLIDGANAEIVATFANNGLKSWKKKGKFRIVQGVYGPDFEKVALIAVLCLLERVRRRQRASRNHGGGGGP